MHLPRVPRACISALIGVLAFAMALTTSRAADAPIALEQLFANPLITRPRLSPDGTRVAYLTALQGRIGVALYDVATTKSDVLVRSGDEDIADFFWKGSDYVVFAADVGGNESAAWQSIHVGTRRIQRLIESWGRNNQTRQHGNWGSLITVWRSNPRKIIVFGSRDENSFSGDYYAVDVGTGRREPLLGMDEGERRETLSVLFDHTGRLRVRSRQTDKHVAVEARLGTSNAFTLLFTQPRDLLLSGLSSAVILADNRTLVFVDYTRADRGELLTLDLDTGLLGASVFSPPAGEITGVQLSVDRSRVIGVDYEADKPATHWLDENRANTHASLNQALPGRVITMVSTSDDEKRLLVHVGSDRDPGVYVLLDRTGPKGRLVPVSAINPNIDPEKMAPMEPVKFAARDGLELSGYLTRPLNHQGKPQALIIHPHGGPYGVRDSWGFDPEVQFLASRGYAVLQVNYRGSGGYGRKFLEAGRFEWGGKMQDDLTDAVKWAIAQGIADPDRVAISGASYGGYAALAGVTFTPELYRCAINYVGVSDLTMLGERDLGTSRNYDRLFHSRWVHWDEAVLKARSPARFVAAIRVPTFHAYGKNDPRVEFRHWKVLKAELDRLKKPYEVLVEEDEGHGFRNETARTEIYRRIETFLAKNLPPNAP